MEKWCGKRVSQEAKLQKSELQYLVPRVRPLGFAALSVPPENELLETAGRRPQQLCPVVEPSDVEAVDIGIGIRLSPPCWIAGVQGAGIKPFVPGW